LIYLAIKN